MPLHILYEKGLNVNQSYKSSPFMAYLCQHRSTFLLPSEELRSCTVSIIHYFEFVLLCTPDDPTTCRWLGCVHYFQFSIKIICVFNLPRKKLDYFFSKNLKFFPSDAIKHQENIKSIKKITKKKQNKSVANELYIPEIRQQGTCR